MIERLAHAAGRSVSRETFAAIANFAALITREAANQNLISSTTLDSLWDRHILDSAQLVRFVPDMRASWADIGSGAGLPGIVIALLTEGKVTLIEPRRLRAEFLTHAVAELGLANRVQVAAMKAERVVGQFDVITARAVANLGRTLDLSRHLSTQKSVWVLPKGRSADTELAEARRAWQGEFRLKPSMTDKDARIVIATKVKARGR